MGTSFAPSSTVANYSYDNRTPLIQKKTFQSSEKNAANEYFQMKRQESLFTPRNEYLEQYKHIARVK